MKLHISIAVALSVSFGGCDKKSEDAAAPAKDSPAKAAAPQPDTKAANSATAATDNPCELLTEAVIRKHFKLADDVELNQDLSSTPYPHCNYSWSTLTPEEEKKEQAAIAEAAIARAKNKGTGQSIADMAMGQMSGRGSAHLTMTKEFDNEQGAIGALTSARSFMEKRAKTKAGGEEIDLTTVFADVEGIGAKAHYAKKSRQLSFAHGKRLYHLGAKSQEKDADHLELAKTIAKEILP
jgi:hypothetical protein